MRITQPEKYNAYLKRVIDWNAVVGQRDIELQRSLVASEVEETLDAIYLNDEKEIIDGVCDVFVTFAYLNYLLTGSGVGVGLAEHDLVLDPMHTINNIRAASKYGTVISHYDMMVLLDWAEYTYGQDVVENYMERVLDSNDSKFVPVDQWDEEHELRVAAEKYAGKFENITAVSRELDGQTVWLLRADGGEGKLLKPTTFFEP